MPRCLSGGPLTSVRFVSLADILPIECRRQCEVVLLRLYREEQPRAILVGWDTLEVPTYRHEKFPAYQSGREFDDALVDQLELIPEFVAACGFQNAKSPGYEADDFLAAAATAEEKRGGTVLIASGDRDTFDPTMGQGNAFLTDPHV